MNIFDYLTPYDKQMIESYIDMICGSNPYTCNKQPLEKILQQWSNNKKDLFEKFGNEFIVSKKVKYKEEEYSLRNKIHDMIYHTNNNVTTKLYNVFPFPPYGLVNTDEELYQTKKLYYHTIRALLSIDSLANNAFVISYDLKRQVSTFKKSFELPLANGKMVTFQEGTKPMKILQKIANSYNIEGFEDFRNAHSCCLQTKNLIGELCVSIHPLDYMTMSDNDLNWDSCMTWLGDGEYKQGTIEMMNSPCVAVAYLKSSQDWQVNKEITWNNKKWRCLFIIDNDFIFSIKDYPYNSEQMLNAAAGLIAETLGWGENLEVGKYPCESYNKREAVQYNDKTFKISTLTLAMYNDCGCTTNHHFILNPNIEKNEFIYEYYNYSHATATCMHCGELMEGHYSGALTHDDNDRQYCDCCGDRIYSDEAYTVDGTVYCEYCVQQECTWCPISEEYVLNDNTINLYLSKSNERFQESEYMECISISTQVEPIDCPEVFRPDAKIIQDEKTYEWYICPKDLTSAGLALFGIYSEKDLEEYCNKNK